MNTLKDQLKDPRYQKMIKILNMDKNVTSSIIKISKKLKSAFFLALFGVIFGLLGFTGADYLKDDSKYSFLVFYLFLPLCFLGVTFIIISITLERQAAVIKKKKVYPFLIKADWTKLYNEVLLTFFEKTDWVITNFELNNIDHNLKKLGSSTQNNRMIVKYKEITDIVFNIDSKIERIEYETSNGNTREVYKTYIKQKLAVYRSDLIFEDDILLLKNEKFSKSDFETESIEFNKKFEIKANNQLLAAKYFSPKVIDKFSNIPKLEDFQNVKLNNKGISSFIFKIFDYADFSYELCHFKIYFNLNKYLCGIVNEIKEDLNKFYTNFVYVEPFL